MIRFLHVATAHEGREVLREATFAVDPGEIVLLRGATGAGKTTVVRLLLGAERPVRGRVMLAGIDVAIAPAAVLATLRSRLAVIPQNPTLIGARTATENVALALEIAGIASALARSQAAELLESLGMREVASRRVAELSSGEQHRVAIARGLARVDAPVILADDPARELDPAGALVLATLLEERRRAGAAVLVTARELATQTIEAVASRLLVLEGGRVVEPPAPALPAGAWHAAARRAG